MKRLLFIALLCLAPLAEAASVSCGVTDLTARQTRLLANFLAAINAERQARTPPAPAFPTFDAYCADLITSSVLDYIAKQATTDAAKVAAAAEANGDEVAPNAQCSAAGLPNGCTKNEVACFVLAGNTNCS